jgi:anti-sigma factor RsiW
MTDNASQNAEDLRCVEFVDMMTAYLDGALDEHQRRRVDHHLEECEGCQAALQQWRTVIRITGRLTATDVASTDPLIRDRLMATFRIPRRR